MGNNSRTEQFDRSVRWGINVDWSFLALVLLYGIASLARLLNDEYPQEALRSVFQRKSIQQGIDYDSNEVMEQDLHQSIRKVIGRSFSNIILRLLRV